MRFLNQSLAQEIVERTMKIIGHNINVMNEKGVIIGSGDRKRIDSIHEGAVRVIEDGAGFEITADEAEKLHGVKAGINLPINFHDEVAGVIGITGEPEEIRNYGELVKMAAEMIIQQAVLLEEMQWDERLKEELISQLLQGTEALTPYYFERVKRLGIDLDLPRTVVILAAENPSKGYKWIRDKLEKDDLYVMYPDCMVLLKRVHDAREITEWMQGFELLHCKAAIGDYHPEGISQSYQEAAATLKVGKKLDPGKSMYFYQDYKLAVFLARAHELGISENLAPYFQKLQKQDKKGELAETLSAYIEENGDVNGAAGRLFIHRNTLRYRLEKIHELTGKDPRKVQDLLELYLSILQGQIK
ncbi:sugar diacid recognition domain-containing protein [Peribacillus kribbensis]|uniref:sugar diacid recognition domain-containing protein n=1 Tax=Peribacillus kribbensis TaxID=356658 RepID=UPI0004082B94|nr:sugar diacid recognition domain-containing protein [Peribacillus kribbensis]